MTFWTVLLVATTVRVDESFPEQMGCPNATDVADPSKGHGPDNYGQDDKKKLLDPQREPSRAQANVSQMAEQLWFDFAAMDKATPLDTVSIETAGIAHRVTIATPRSHPHPPPAAETSPAACPPHRPLGPGTNTHLLTLTESKTAVVDENVLPEQTKRPIRLLSSKVAIWDIRDSPQFWPSVEANA